MRDSYVHIQIAFLLFRLALHVYAPARIWYKHFSITFQIISKFGLIHANKFNAYLNISTSYFSSITTAIKCKIKASSKAHLQRIFSIVLY